jgi:DNA-binding CsgD family transcriptional regulator
VVIVSGVNDSRIIRMLLDGGARGYIPKFASSELLMDGLRTVLRGEVFVPEGLFLPASHVPGGNGEVALTDRQLQILPLLADGMPNKQIADAWGRRRHRQAAPEGAVQAANARNRTQAVQEARRLARCAGRRQRKGGAPPKRGVIARPFFGQRLVSTPATSGSPPLSHRQPGLLVCALTVRRWRGQAWGVAASLDVFLMARPGLLGLSPVLTFSSMARPGLFGLAPVLTSSLMARPGLFGLAPVLTSSLIERPGLVAFDSAVYGSSAE